MGGTPSAGGAFVVFAAIMYFVHIEIALAKLAFQQNRAPIMVTFDCGHYEDPRTYPAVTTIDEDSC